MEIDDEEPVYISSFKTNLKEEMKTRCDANLNSPVLAKSSFFDKRFSHLKCLDDDFKKKIIEDIKEELAAIAASTERNTNDEIVEEREPAKKKRFLGAGLADSDDDEAPGGVSKELENYLKERKLKVDEDPFAWWRNRRDEYPLMSKLARKYLAVQGTSTPAERVISRFFFIF